MLLTMYVLTSMSSRHSLLHSSRLIAPRAVQWYAPARLHCVTCSHTGYLPTIRNSYLHLHHMRFILSPHLQYFPLHSVRQNLSVALALCGLFAPTFSLTPPAISPPCRHALTLLASHNASSLHRRLVTSLSLAICACFFLFPSGRCVLSRHLRPDLFRA